MYGDLGSGKSNSDGSGGADVCDPLSDVYEQTTAELIKETVTTTTEESQCAGLNFFKEIIPGENQDLITTCTTVSYLCYCQIFKKISPIIAEATSNLLNNS